MAEAKKNDPPNRSVCVGSATVPRSKGEPACLRRSFSHPTSGNPREFTEGDPIRALTESISFGRFVSDSLDWGKWSSFSSNRYLEEAEKFSKPGLVAQKKAFFEARYKKKAATRAASERAEAEAGQEDPNAREASIRLDSFEEVDNDTLLEDRGPCAPSVEISSPADDSVAVQKDAVDESKGMSAFPNPVEEMVNKQPLCVPLRKDEHISEKEAPPSETTTPQLGIVDGSIPSSADEREVKSIASASTPIHSLTSIVAKAMASFQAKTADNAAGNGRKTASKRLEEKNSGPRSLHMSINLASTSNLSQSLKTRGPRFSPIFEKERYNSTSTLNQSKVPTPKHSLCAPPSNVKRIVSILNKSTAEPTRTTTDNRSNPLHPSDSRCREKPAAVCMPFGLRSAERAQKRKEFFMKQQERIAVKEADKRHLGQRSQSPGVTTANKLSITRQPPSGSGKNLTSANSGGSKDKHRMAAHSSSGVRKHVHENASPNIPY